MRKQAFTLAEILITLGIIGIVAAITLPALIQKHQERVTVNKVKKFYSIMSQAQLLAIKDNGYMDEWTVPNQMTQQSAIALMNYIKPYLKIAKDCGTSSGCLQNGNIKLLNGNLWGSYDNRSEYYKVILNDGTYMWLRSTDGIYCSSSASTNFKSCGAVWIDTNGKKPPNTFGHDVFIFSININNITSYYQNDCKPNSRGWSCSDWILEKGNMDYLRQ